MNKIYFRVRYSEVDQMGFVHHSHYINWAEMGRVELFRSAHTNYKAVESEGYGIPLLDANIIFKKAATFDDQIIVITEILKLTKTRITFLSKIYQAKEHLEINCLLASVTTTHCFLDLKLKKPVRAPDFLYAILENKTINNTVNNDSAISTEK